MGFYKPIIDKNAAMCLMDFFLPPNNPSGLVIIRIAASRLGDKFNWSMTLGELLHSKTVLVIFYF